MIEVLEVGLKEMRNNSNLTYSYWYVTGLCNYECHYCDIFHDEKVQEWHLKKDIVDFFNYWGTVKQQKVLLYGGEPTLDPDFPKIIEGLNDYIRVFTNLYRGVEYWKDIVSIRKDLTVSISYHIHKVNHEEFLKKVEYLVEESEVNMIRVKIMGDSRYRQESIDKYNFFKGLWKNEPRYECYIDLVFPNSEGNIGAEWIEEDIDWFLPIQDYQTLYLKYKENGKIKERETSWNEMRATMLEYNHYYHCMAGVNTLFVNSDGNVYLCKSHNTTPLFSVQDDYKSLEISQKGMICSYMGFCCETEIPKRLVCKRRITNETKNIRSVLI